MRYGIFSLLLPLAVLAAGIAQAQGPAYKLGSMATEEEINSWDIAISPDGDGLPPGRGTAVEGRQVYTRHCAVCHGPTGAEVMYPGGYPPPLLQTEEAPVTGHHIKSVTNYWPFATTIWDYINRAMPATSPLPPSVSSTPIEWSGISPGASVLSADEVYAVTAYLLHRGGVIGEHEVMDAESLPKVQMPNRAGFVPPDPTDWYPRMHLDPHISPLSGADNVGK